MAGMEKIKIHMNTTLMGMSSQLNFWIPEAKSDQPLKHWLMN